VVEAVKAYGVSHYLSYRLCEDLQRPNKLYSGRDVKHRFIICFRPAVFASPLLLAGGVHLLGSQTPQPPVELVSLALYTLAWADLTVTRFPFSMEMHYIPM